MTLSSQIMLFLKFCLIGFCFGSMFGLSNLLSMCFKNNAVFRLFLDLGICGAMLFLTTHYINILNMGELRIYIIFAIIIGILIERRTVGKLFAKFYNWLYNRFVTVNNKFKVTTFGKIIFK